MLSLQTDMCLEWRVASRSKHQLIPVDHFRKLLPYLKFLRNVSQMKFPSKQDVPNHLLHEYFLMQPLSFLIFAVYFEIVSQLQCFLQPLFYAGILKL